MRIYAAFLEGFGLLIFAKSGGEFFAAKDDFRCFVEECEEFCLGFGEREGFAVSDESSALRFEGESCDSFGFDVQAYGGAGGGCELSWSGGSSEDGSYSQEEFFWWGGFDEVVVGAEFESCDTHIGFFEGGVEEDGELVSSAESCEEVDTGFVGHHDVEDHEVVGFFVEDIFGFSGVTYGVYVESVS